MVVSKVPDAPRTDSARQELQAAAALVALAAAALLAQVPAPLVERLYASGMYAFIQPLLTLVANLVPIALVDLLLTGAAAAFIVWIARAVRWPRTHIWRLFTRTAALAAGAVLAMTVTFGANFRRESLRDSPRFVAERVTYDSVVALAERAVRTLNSAHAQLPATWPSPREMRAALAPAVAEASRALGMSWRPRAARPKLSALNLMLERTGLNGIFVPPFLEVVVNESLLSFEQPYVLAHEWGHGAGRANESEAAYFGWIVCSGGPVWAQYSAWLRVHEYALAELSREDRARIVAMLEAGPRADLRARDARFRASYNPRAARVRRAVDRQISAAGRVRPEQRNYGLVVQLILGLPGAAP